MHMAYEWLQETDNGVLPGTTSLVFRISKHVSAVAVTLITSPLKKISLRDNGYPMSLTNSAKPRFAVSVVSDLH